MRMQEICKISGFTKRNIHYYIKEGLLSPLLMFRTVIMIFQRKK